ncbi:MAG: phospho-sugar mutase [Prevotellaceae bacterium]|jgi:phosphoglucomutase|nr:phospho-sugar mutase [Prevotellaceae bacterium]
MSEKNQEPQNMQVVANITSWLKGSYDEETKQQLRELIAKKDNTREVIDCFYRSLEFGTGGLRGIMGVGTNRMNKYTVGMATQGLANYLKQNFADLPQVKVAIAYDCRNNSSAFAKIVADIFAANDFHVYLFDALRPTPELSFAIRLLGCQSGVMVTASHNPKEYNGYKAYWSDGAQVTAPHDRSIIYEVSKITDPSQVKFTGGNGSIEIIGEEVDEAYLSGIESLLKLSPAAIERHRDIKIVYTPLHGCGVKLAPAMLARMGFTNVIHVPEQDVNDGNFPTVYSPNPEEPTALKMAIDKALATGAELVLATDPDADRIALAVRDKKGDFLILNGNQTNAIFTYYLLRRWKELGKLHGKEYTVKTIVTTNLIAAIAEAFDVECYSCYTGFKYIAEIVRKYEGKKIHICGGEESFGFNVGELVRDKDSIVSCGLAAEVTAWAKEQGLSMFDLLLDIYRQFGYYKERQISATKQGKEGLEAILQMMRDFRANPPKSLAGSDVKEIYDYQILELKNVKSGEIKDIDQPSISNVLQYVTEDGTIVSVRPSGTEPKIKFYFGVRQNLNSADEFDSVTKALDEKIDAIAAELKL